MRFLKYFLLAILTIVTPYVTTMLLIIVSMDRVEGMKFGVMPGIIIPHLIFGLIFIDPTANDKIFTDNRRDSDNLWTGNCCN